MANIGQAKNDLQREIEIKYIPIAGNYKGCPLDISVMGEGRLSKARLQPHQWQKVSVAVAKEALAQVAKAKRQRMVPDGGYMEDQMGTNRYDNEDGAFRSAQRMEGGEPDYEIQTKGTI